MTGRSSHVVNRSTKITGNPIPALSTDVVDGWERVAQWSDDDASDSDGNDERRSSCVHKRTEQSVKIQVFPELRPTLERPR